ncbi:MAG: phage holin family protein [Thermoleophilaceae bacterium]|nr:phage holin family protein [Thermoleophilaceae bacterium]
MTALRRLPRLALRIALVWLLDAGALLLLGAILPGVSVEDFGVAVAAAALIGLANGLVWPLVIRFALPVAVLTLGLGSLVLNGLVILAAAQLDAGLRIDGLFSAIVVALGLTLITTLAGSALAIDDDGVWTRNVVRRQARRVARAAPTDVPGLFFLEIDGLGHDVLRRAIRDGNAPTLARWLRDGSHRLIAWETGWSSQTGACQAGLLHGDDFDYPAFRWWEKERGKPMVTNHPRDAAELERRRSDGKGLLHEDGASRANILSGDAPHTLLTMSAVGDPGRRRISRAYYAYFASPYNFARTFLLCLADIAQERWFAAQQRRRDVRPRIDRSRSYALMRAWGTVFQRDLQVEAIIGDLYAGRPVAYTTFLAYDEVAHHSGIERADALSTLRRLDHQIARIEAAASHGPRPYRFVVLSDHGQSQGATFQDRYGASLEDLVIGASEAGEAQVAADESDVAAGYARASLGRSEPRQGAEAEGDVPELSVMASGCLGLISFPREPGRATLEWIEARHPRLIPTLRDHPGIGFLLVRSRDRGPLVIGRTGTHELESGRVEGESPLAPFGPNAARHVARTDGFPHCADIMVNGTYWEDSDEVAAFEDLVGSHGGMGGAQCHPFALAPVDFHAPDEPIVGAVAMHRLMRRWLADLGHDAYRGGERRTGAGSPA